MYRGASAPFFYFPTVLKEMVVPKTTLTQHSVNLQKLLEEGEQDALYAYVAELSRRMSHANRVQDKDWWCRLGKEVLEPAFLKFVLNPQGVNAEANPDIYDLDFIFADLKWQSSPFFVYSSRHTYTINAGDIRKYPDDAVIYLWHYRASGSVWRVNNFEQAYTGPHMNVICRTTMGEIKRLIKKHRVEKEPYKERLNDEAGNEPWRFVLDIRWFPIWLRRVDGKWTSQPWTAEELAHGVVEVESQY